MKTVILSPKPKKEQEFIYLEDLSDIYKYTIVCDRNYILIINDEGYYQWFAADEMMVFGDTFKSPKEAIKYREVEYGIEDLDFYEIEEFRIDKLIK